MDKEEQYSYEQFIRDCAEVCMGWTNCSYADDNPGSCPLLNGFIGAGDPEDASFEKGNFPWTF